jgi:hypothetical protein
MPIHKIGFLIPYLATPSRGWVQPAISIAPQSQGGARTHYLDRRPWQAEAAQGDRC